MKKILIHKHSLASWIVLFSLFWGAVVLTLSYEILRSYQHSVESAVLSQLRQDISSAGLKDFTKSLKDLVNLGFLKCPKLETLFPQKYVIADLSLDEVCPHADRSKFVFSFTGINGSQLKLSSILVVPTIYTISLWSFYLFGVVAFFLLTLLFKNREIFNLELQKLETQHDRNMSLLAAQLAHDLRSPAGALQVLRSKLSAHDSSVTSLAASVSERIDSLSKNLLDNYKEHRVKSLDGEISVSEKSLPLKVHAYSLNEAISLLIDEIKIGIQNRNIRINFFPQEDVLTHHLEVSDLHRMLSNLINNGIESIEKNGFVTVDVTVFDGFYSISVRDNGAGMDSDVLKKALSGVSTKKQGHGLGLSSALARIKQIGGSYEVQSEKGRGTLVKLTLVLPSR